MIFSEDLPGESKSILRLPVTTMSLSQVFALTFGIIATASIVSNALFCFLLYKNPGLLKKPHNILLLSLATIDMTTGNLIVSRKSNLLTKT